MNPAPLFELEMTISVLENATKKLNRQLLLLLKQAESRPRYYPNEEHSIAHL